MVAFAVTMVASATFSSCGYRVAGRANTLPAEIHTIAVPAFTNKTQRYRIEQRMTEAVIHEFLARTKYRIVSDPRDADAVLHGEITGLESSAVVFDPATGRATTMLVQVHMRVWLDDTATKKVLFRSEKYLFRQEYQISTDVTSFFDEQDPALDRMARDFASHVVADILESF
ncbi:MAG TPA: LptE family protein [Candidatus Acidoferrales bacterium]|nr:LptE family protein [Candidatus Acidoferrales bacterium]